MAVRQVEGESGCRKTKGANRGMSEKTKGKGRLDSQKSMILAADWLSLCLYTFLLLFVSMLSLFFISLL